MPNSLYVVNVKTEMQDGREDWLKSKPIEREEADRLQASYQATGFDTYMEPANGYDRNVAI